MKKEQLWHRWTLANALSEMVGLGLTFLITGFAFSMLDNQGTMTSILLSFFFAVASGAVEAIFVGFAQWWAMRPWFLMIERFAWWRGALIGALIAYVFGYLPSTLMSMGEATASSAPAVDAPQWVVLLLAFKMSALWQSVLVMAEVLFAAGAIVGTIHGRFLMSLAEES